MLLLSKKLWPCCAWILVCWQNIWHSKSFSPLNEPYLYSCIFKNKSNVPVEHRSPNTGKPKIDGYHVLVLNTWCNSRSWVSNYSHKWLPNVLLTKLKLNAQDKEIKQIRDYCELILFMLECTFTLKSSKNKYSKDPSISKYLLQASA